jgi:23S rRNA (cytosine1962-C5)-methyltransferase
MARRTPSVVLTQRLEDVLALGHPWIWEDAIDHRGARASTGDVVDVVTRSGDWIGRGVLDLDSPLRVRLWTRREGEDVGPEMLERRIRAAKRRRPFPAHDTTGYRLLHGEGDRVPGLVCDVYGEVGVLRPDGLAAERWLDHARDVIGPLCGVNHWVVRRAAIYKGSHEVAEWWGDPAPGGARVEFLEHGARYVCDVIEGQKTGFFLDQRANRARLASHAVGRRVLNLCGYTGGFSVAAAMAGAARTTTVDLAAPAIAMARENFALNGLPAAAHAFEVADVFDFLEPFDPGSAPFEVAVCDPPSFAHRRRDVPKARDAYTRLFAQLLGVMPTGSTVALASCSSHIDRALFLKIAAQAARDAGVELVLGGVHGADVDHPVLPGFPEGDYLQCVFGTVSRD